MAETENIRDYVLPLVEVLKKSEGYEFKSFHGTCFLIGKEGYALTNSHLLGNEDKNVLCALTIDDSGEWTVHEIAASESHPTEDIALLQLPDLNNASFLQLTDSFENSSCAYMQWSYPEEVVKELVKDGRISERPDLVYLEGYIRRRISSMELPAIKGSSFYEVSEAATVGCSGSPIIKKNTRNGDYWQVIGVYVGSRNTQTGQGYTSIGYAVRLDSFAGWEPAMLNCSLLNYSLAN